MRTRNILIACIAVASALPVFTHAQAAYDELRAQVRTRLSQDPATAQMSPEAYGALVEALTAEAVRQGVPASDFAPATTPSVAAAHASVCDAPVYLCIVADAFGLSPIAALWVLFGILATILFVLLGIVIERHHAHAHPVA